MTEKTAESVEKKSDDKLSGKVITWMVILVVVTGVVSWFAFAAVYGVGVGSSNPAPAKTQGGGGPAYVYLSINANPDIQPASADQYEPANFTVPAHTELVFVITNYDNGENTLAPSYYKVHGTVGNVEYLNGSSTGVSSIPTGQVAHTFTILSGAYAGFNVPIPAAGSTPSVVEFSAYFNTTGTFTWNCMAACDSWSMGTPGYMMGSITVT